MKNNITQRYKDCLHHETKNRALKKYLLLLTIIIAYFFLMSLKYGLEDGFSVTLLTWSFFVFGTPIADAGFLLDFPIRLIAKIRMVYSEIGVWVIAGLINFYTLSFNSGIYEKTEILQLLHKILTHPFPFWAIIGLSAAGTFFSIYFGDELMDIIKHKDRIKYITHKNKHHLIIMLSLFVSIVLGYTYIANKLAISI